MHLRAVSLFSAGVGIIRLTDGPPDRTREDWLRVTHSPDRHTKLRTQLPFSRTVNVVIASVAKHPDNVTPVVWLGHGLQQRTAVCSEQMLAQSCRKKLIL